MAEDAKQVVLDNADGTQTFVQPEIFDGKLVLAVQHENGFVVRHDPDSNAAKRLVSANPDVAALLSEARTAAKAQGVRTATETSVLGDVDRVIAALKAAGLVVTPVQTEPAG